MNRPILFALILLTIIWYAMRIYRKQNRAQGILEQTLAKHNPDFTYDYNRFNTQAERCAIVDIQDDYLGLEADVHIIQICNHTLILHLHAKLEQTETYLAFKLLVQPFDKELLETDDYQSILMADGYFFFISAGLASEGVFDFAEREKIIDRPLNGEGNFILKLHEMITDPGESRIILTGKFPDGQLLEINLDIQAFKLQLKAPLDALRKRSNYQNTAEMVIP